jgi:CubicO group peptidase (beta-lactamase class C family)
MKTLQIARRFSTDWPARNRTGRQGLDTAIPAGNGIGRVRDIAKLYGELATTPDPPSGGPRDAVLKTETAYSLGYWKPFDGFAFGSPSAFGAQGAGGSFAFADPERDLGFAYAPNKMGTHIWDDPRESALRDAVLDCLDTE